LATALFCRFPSLCRMTALLHSFLFGAVANTNEFAAIEFSRHEIDVPAREHGTLEEDSW